MFSLTWRKRKMCSYPDGNVILYKYRWEKTFFLCRIKPPLISILTVNYSIILIGTDLI